MHCANVESFGKAIILWLGGTIKCGMKINVEIELYGNYGFLLSVREVQQKSDTAACRGHHTAMINHTIPFGYSTSLNACVCAGV